MKKICCSCKELKDITEFSKNRCQKDGFCHQCKSCVKKSYSPEKERLKYLKNKEKSIKRSTNWRMKHKFGITSDDKKNMFLCQNKLCKICSTEMTLVGGSDNSAQIDHCHKTGKIRGIICRKCNLGIGHFNDSPELLEKAIKYLLNL